MTENVITVDVYASWGDATPCYRIYVDDNLLTERAFIWNGTNTYIQERIIVNLNPGPHNLKVEQINNSGSIQIKNITLNDMPSSSDFVTTE